jgi:hypothetical protein
VLITGVILKKQKKSFVLLEVLIAIFILSTLVLPFTFLPYKTLENRKNLLVQLELEREAHLLAANIREKLYSMTPIALPTAEGKKMALSRLTPEIKRVKIEVPKSFSCSFDRQIFLYKIKSKQLGENFYHLVQVIISYLPAEEKTSKKNSSFIYNFSVCEKLKIASKMDL